MTNEKPKKGKAPAKAADDLNKSGIRPAEFKVLVLPDDVERVTKGGVIKTDESVMAEKYAVCKGLLVAASAEAFTFYTNIENAPKAGMRVFYGKWAGGEVKGADGVSYRLMNDKDIAATLDFEVPVQTASTPVLTYKGAAA